MKTNTALSASLLCLALACSGEVTSDDLFDGSTSSSWSTAGDPTATTEIRNDEQGNAALSASGDSAETASFSFKVPAGAAAGSSGVSFRIRGSAGVRFSATTSAVVPVEDGGTCTATAEYQCWDLFATNLAVDTEWQTVILSWAQLMQSEGGVPATFIADDLTHLNWQVNAVGNFNIWIDDIRFVLSVTNPTIPSNPSAGSGGMTGDGDGDLGTGGVVASTGGAMATGGTAATGGSAAGTGGMPNESDNRLGKYVPVSMFLSAFNGRNPAYKYSKLLDAVDVFAEFASCCSETEKKREIAAFLAHVQHESDYLNATDEYTPASTYCQQGEYTCAPGKSYHGRGALQLTWNYNYQFAQDWFATQGLNYDLVARPEQVSSNEELLWTTALWFWMEGDPSFFNDTMHDRLKTGGFGSTIDKINGGLECGPGASNPGAVTKRIEYYKDWCMRLGVDPGSNLTC